MQGKDLAFLEAGQEQFLEIYSIMEEAQGEYPEFYSFFQKVMDKADHGAELIRMGIYCLNERR